MTGTVVTVGKFIVLQMTEDAFKKFKDTFELDGDFVFSEYDEDDIKIVAEFDGIGQGELV